MAVFLLLCSGFDSLTHQQRDTILHSRNPSAVSDISGYGTGSRSMGGQRENGHIRNPSSGSNTGFLSLRKVSVTTATGSTPRRNDYILPLSLPL